MGYQLNVKAYELFVQLEVGLREFLILSIKNIGVYEWTNKFIGTTQRDTISDVVKRINDSYKNDETPELADQYIYKLTRAKKEMVFKTSKLFHPFYYMSWTDIESILRLKNNSSLIDSQIGKLNRETIIETLKPLSHLRNDIAHSRFITMDNYRFIKASFDKISVLIPNFESTINNQSIEQTVESLLDDLSNVTKKIEDGKILDLQEMDIMQQTLFECENSFWLNSENLELIGVIKSLIQKLNEYKLLRSKQGGLLEIQTMKPQLRNIVLEITKILHG